MQRSTRLVVLICSFAAAAAPAAQAADQFAWVLADRPDATAAYAPNPNDSYNSVGGTVTVTPLGTGYYRVDFGRLASAGHNNVQVSAYQTNGYCTAAGWDAKGPGNNGEAWVQCFDANGNAANAGFALFYQARTKLAGSSRKGNAFLLADQPTTARYTPNPLYSYNPLGQANTIARTGVGAYAVTIPGLSAQGGDVQITAYNPTGAPRVPARCKPVTWTSSKVANTIQVACFDSAGAPADQSFSLAFALQSSFAQGPAATQAGSYGWANDATATTAYTMPLPYNYSFNTSLMTSQKVATGHYTVNIQGALSYRSSLALVTAYGDNNQYCAIQAWFPISVLCYQQGGAPIDAQFDVTFQMSH